MEGPSLSRSVRLQDPPCPYIKVYELSHYTLLVNLDPQTVRTRCVTLG